MAKYRKKPAQKRSKTLFESVIESAARILPAFGYAHATTNRIAKRAGISVGSLYQYFPNKDAIIAGLLERELDKHFDEVAVVLDRMKEKSLDDVIDVLVEKFYDLYLGQKELSRELFIAASRIGLVGETLYIRNRIVEALSEQLIQRQGIGPEVARIKAFVSLNAFMGVIQTCCLVSELPADETETKKELSTLLQAYLQKSLT